MQCNNNINVKEGKFESLNIGKSPLEFVLIGPHRGKDMILVRSDGAGLDLVGLAADKEREFEIKETIRSPLLFLGGSRQLNVIESRRINDLKPDYDARRSSYKFAWVGSCSSIPREKMQRSLDNAINEIRDGLLDSNKADIEMALAPLILKCTLENERRLRSRKMLYLSIITYVAAGSIALLVLLIQKILR